MADLGQRVENRSVVLTTVDWSAVWAGLFTFVAIWSVFGVLGFAIFPIPENAAVNTGWGIWSIILTAVAMYIAGHQTGRLAGGTGRYHAVWHGMVMFGLTVLAAIVLMVAGNSVFPAAGTSTLPVRSYYSLTLFGGSGWIMFLGLLLGWLAAMAGAASAKRASSEEVGNVKTIRPAA